MEVLSTLIRTVKVEPGVYFLGDPCYAVPQDDWMDLLNTCELFNLPIGKIKGYDVLGFNTKWGDGIYLDQFGNEYPVDSGTIGLTPLEYAAHTPDYLAPSHGQIVTFKDFVECTGPGHARPMSWNGVLLFGHYKINTDPA